MNVSGSIGGSTTENGSDLNMDLHNLELNLKTAVSIDTDGIKTQLQQVD